LVAFDDTVDTWDDIPLKDLPDWIHEKCPLEVME